MKTLIDKVKKIALNSLHYVSRAYFQQREKELKFSRDKWKQKAIDRQAVIAKLEKELKVSRNELKKNDYQ